MLMNRLAYFILGQLAFASPKGLAQSIPSTTQERASYECAKSVGNLVERAAQSGPVFFESGLVFASVDSKAGNPILVLSMGTGTFELALDGAGLNRIRFIVPGALNEKSKTFYMSYMHGSATMRSRYFDFGVERPPLGHDEMDYTEVKLIRASHLLDHLDYAIHQTMENTMTALTEGRLERTQVLPSRVASCDRIAQRSPSVGRSVRRNLDVVEMIVIGPKPAMVARPASRMPASLYP